MLKARGGQAAEGQGGLPRQSGTGFPWGATAVRCSSHPDTAAGLPGRSQESRGLRGGRPSPPSGLAGGGEALDCPRPDSGPPALWPGPRALHPTGNPPGSQGRGAGKGGVRCSAGDR